MAQTKGQYSVWYAALNMQSLILQIHSLAKRYSKQLEKRLL